MNRIEYRYAGSTHTRSADNRTLIGYAAVFHRPEHPGTEYHIGSDVVERIDRHAFDRAVRDDDVRALFNHDASQILARTTAGTLRLSVDGRGLRYEIDLPDTSTGRMVRDAIQRGDVTGSSFGFVPTRVRWIDEPTRSIRLIEEASLVDVGPVTFPAYEATSATLESQPQRSSGEAEAEAEAVAVRLRLLQLDDHASRYGVRM